MPIQTITIDLSCVKCGANLRGEHPKGKCPECGERVVDSLTLQRIKCAACGVRNSPMNAACKSCGAGLPAAEVQSPEEEPGAIEEEIRCTSCGYVLRGLMESGRCPECGTEVATTMEKMAGVVLCLNCMTANPQVAAVCQSCGQPMTGAGMTANYYRGVARSGLSRRSAKASFLPHIKRAAFTLFFGPQLLAAATFGLGNLMFCFSRSATTSDAVLGIVFSAYAALLAYLFVIVYAPKKKK